MHFNNFTKFFNKSIQCSQKTIYAEHSYGIWYTLVPFRQKFLCYPSNLEIIYISHDLLMNSWIPLLDFKHITNRVNKMCHLHTTFLINYKQGVIKMCLKKFVLIFCTTRHSPWFYYFIYFLLLIAPTNERDRIWVRFHSHIFLLPTMQLLP